MNRLYILTFMLVMTVSCAAQDAEIESKPILYLFLSDECIITQYYVTTLNEISLAYRSDIDMVAIFPNFSSKPNKIEAFYKKYGLKITHRTDYYKSLSRSLGATVTPEAILLDSSGKKVYQGRIDNSYVAIGKRRRVVSTRELADAIESILSEKKVATPRTEAIGCFINFSDEISSKKPSQQ